MTTWCRQALVHQQQRRRRSSLKDADISRADGGAVAAAISRLSYLAAGGRDDFGTDECSERDRVTSSDRYLCVAAAVVAVCTCGLLTAVTACSAAVQQLAVLGHASIQRRSAPPSTARVFRTLYTAVTTDICSAAPGRDGGVL